MPIPASGQLCPRPKWSQDYWIGTAKILANEVTETIAWSKAPRFEKSSIDVTFMSNASGSAGSNDTLVAQGGQLWTSGEKIHGESKLHHGLATFPWINSVSKAKLQVRIGPPGQGAWYRAEYRGKIFFAPWAREWKTLPIGKQTAPLWCSIW